MSKDLFNRYIWLADTIYRAGKITFEEITEKWNKSALNSGEELTLRTFHNHRNAVETLFDIDIECTKSGGYYYYIKNSDDLENSGVKQWMLSSLTVRNLINESAGLKDRILFEEMPSGKEYLSPIIEAMKENIVLDVHYQSFKADEPKSYIIEPYCVKVFKQRWYLIGRDVAKNQVHIYGLDRIHKINYTKLKFKYPPRFNPKEFFDTCFGITVEDGLRANIIQLKVDAMEAKYFRALPLHHSQKEIQTTDEYSVFEYLIKPTYDFIQEILSHADKVEVLSPSFVRDVVAAYAGRMADIYFDSYDEDEDVDDAGAEGENTDNTNE